jgi:hypothetical protein
MTIKSKIGAANDTRRANDTEVNYKNFLTQKTSGLPVMMRSGKTISIKIQNIRQKK